MHSHELNTFRYNLNGLRKSLKRMDSLLRGNDGVPGKSKTLWGRKERIIYS